MWPCFYRLHFLPEVPRIFFLFDAGRIQRRQSLVALAFDILEEELILVIFCVDGRIKRVYIGFEADIAGAKKCQNPVKMAEIVLENALVGFDGLRKLL